MRRHRSIGLLAGTLLALVIAGSAAAKENPNEVVVALDTPDNPHAGSPIKVGVMITRPDGSAIRGEVVSFQLVRNGGIGLLTVKATEETMGHYTATVTVPDKGSWSVIVIATGDGMTQTYIAGDLTIGASLAPAVPSSPAAPAAPGWLLIAGLAAVAVAAGLGGRIVATRRRSAVAADRA